MSIKLTGDIRLLFGYWIIEYVKYCSNPQVYGSLDHFFNLKFLFLFSHLFWDFWVLSSVTTMLTYYYFSSMFNGNGPSGGAAEFSFARGGLNRWLRVSNDPPLTKLSFQTYCRSKCFILKFIVTSYKTKVATKFLIYLFNEIF